MGTSGEIILYTAESGAQVQLRAVQGTVWLTQAQVAELYGTSVPNIAQIIARVLADGEVTEATINSELVVRQEGSRQVRREIKIYNLDMILAIGYRVTTPRAVQFRQWATTILREYLVKGFAMDDAKLKGVENWDYFDEWLARIRDIRASEKRFYQKICDLYATAIDYDKNSEDARAFFARVQNQMLWAVTGEQHRRSSPSVVTRMRPTWGSLAGRVRWSARATSASPRTTCTQMRSSS